MISMPNYKDIIMEIKFPHRDIGKVPGIQIIETKSITIFMIQREDSIMLTTNGILSSDGALKTQVAKLLHHLILILTFRVHIMITMILETRRTIGLG